MRACCSYGYILLYLLHLSLAQTPSGFLPSTSSPLVIQYAANILSTSGELVPEGAVVRPPTIGTPAALNGTYLAVMVDPTAGTPTDTVEVLHYLISGLASANHPATSNGTTYFPLITSDQPLAPYLPPEPTPGKAHTYTITLWEQPSNFAVPSAYSSYLPLNESNLTNRYPFNLTGLASAAALGVPVKAGYFNVQNDTSSPSTTASGPSGTATGQTAMTSSPASHMNAGGHREKWLMRSLGLAILATLC